MKLVIKSISSAFQYLGVSQIIVSNKLLLPGVGSFSKAIDEKQKPILFIM